MTRTSVLSCAAALAIAGCSSAPLQRENTRFATKELVRNFASQRVAINVEHLENISGMCHAVQEQKKFEQMVGGLTPRKIEWPSRQAGDLLINASWTCLELRDPGTHAVDGLLTVATIFTLGTLPTAPTYGELKLDVTMTRDDKSIFVGHYKIERKDVSSIFFGNGTEGLAQDFAANADVLVDQFLKEVDQDGALDQ